MLQPKSHDGLKFVTAPADQCKAAIDQLIRELSDDDSRTCPHCEYTAVESRWGLQTFETTDPDRRALVLCCPTCETRIDLELETDTDR